MSSGEAVGLTIFDEEPAIGIGQVVAGIARKRRRGLVDAALAPFDFDKGADGVSSIATVTSSCANSSRYFS